MASLTLASLLRAASAPRTLVTTSTVAAPTASQRLHSRLSRLSYAPATSAFSGRNGTSLRVAAFSTSPRSSFSFSLALREPKKVEVEEESEVKTKRKTTAAAGGAKKTVSSRSSAKTKKTTAAKAATKTKGRATKTKEKTTKASTDKKPRRASAAAKKKVPKKKVIKKKKVVKKTPAKLRFTRDLLPPKRPLNSFARFYKEFYRENREEILALNGTGPERVREASRRAVERWHSLSDAEKREYLDKYYEELPAYEEAYKKYFETTSPEVLKVVNTRNKKLGKNRVIDPNRQRKLPTAFLLFHIERMQTEKIPGRSVPNSLASGARWREMSDSEKKVYQDRYLEAKKEREDSASD